MCSTNEVYKHTDAYTDTYSGAINRRECNTLHFAYKPLRARTVIEPSVISPPYANPPDTTDTWTSY